MVSSTIKFSQIEDRIDAEYYKPEYFKIYNDLKKNDAVLLKDIAKEIVSGSYIDTYFLQGVLYLRVNNLREDGFDFSDVKYVDIQYSKISQKIRVHTNDLILGRTGTVGVALIVSSELNGAVMSQHITKIVPKDTINRFYLMVYLNSRYGRLQAERTALGSMQKELTLEATKDIKIFIPSQSFQQKIEKMVKEAERKRKLADEKYKEAEEILNKELGLENLDLSTQKTFEAKFSEAKDRFDPEYYQPKYKKIISKLKTQKSKLLGEIVKISKNKLDPTKSPSIEVKYVELANINGSDGIIEDCGTYKHWQLPGRARMLIRSGDVLISSLGGSINKVGLVSKEYDGQVASTGFFVVNSDVINSETLFLVFRNKIVSSQLERNTRGAIMSAISENEFKNMLIPVISKPTQQKISSLIQESFKLRREAKELIDRAKKEVEAMVEGKIG